MMRKFRRLLSELDIKDLYLNCRLYTWSNELEWATMKRLDRIFSTAGISFIFSLGNEFLYLGPLPFAALCSSGG
jgi:hypothetical protein